MYVPPDQELRRDVLRMCHDSPTAGHPGVHGTMELLEARFWWPTIRSFAEKYVEGCEDCSRRKTIRHPQASMQPLDVPAGPWEQVGVDLITQLPKAHGFDAIMVCVWTTSPSRSMPSPVHRTSRPLGLPTSIVERSFVSTASRYGSLVTEACSSPRASCKNSSDVLG